MFRVWVPGVGRWAFTPTRFKSRKSELAGPMCTGIGIGRVGVCGRSCGTPFAIEDLSIDEGDARENWLPKP